MRIGFVGYSTQEFDKIRAEVIILRIFNEIHANRDRDEVIEIVSGAVNLGISKMVYDMARICKYETVGIMCNKGYEHDLNPVNKLIVVGENWGEESNTFLNNIDILYRIGGGKQSHKEVEMAKEKGIKVIEYNL